jgi:hypothetical protein
MIEDGKKTIRHATGIVARDDAASSETITERPQVEEASGDGEGNDPQDHGRDRPVPFARSRTLNHHWVRQRVPPTGAEPLAVTV